jgi:HEAT repeat protein
MRHRTRSGQRCSLSWVTSRNRAPMMMTVRSREILPSEIQLRLDAFEIQPLDDRAVTAFIEAYSHEPEKGLTTEEIWFRLKSQDLLGPGALGRNPFWLGVILQNRVFDEKNRAALLNAAVERLLTREWTKADSKRSWKRAEERDDQLRHTEVCLDWLAYQMTWANCVSLGVDEAKLVTDDCIKKRIGTEVLKPDDVLWLARDALLLDFRAGGKPDANLRFRHRLLQNYFAAEAMHAEASLLTPEILDSVSEDARWWSALLMLNELHHKDAWPLDPDKKHAGLVGSVVGRGSNAMRTILANAMVWDIDKMTNEELERRVRQSLSARLAADEDSDLVNASNRLASVSPEAFARVPRPLAESEELRSALRALLTSVLRSAVESRAADQLIVQLFEEFYLRSVTKDALVALGDQGAESIVRALQQRLSWGVVETLGDLRSPAAVDELLRLLPSAEEFLQGQIIDALGKIGDPRAIEALAEFTRSPDLLTRSRAVDALAKIGAPAVNTLVEIVRRRDDTLLQLAVELGLKRIGPPAAARLSQALEDNNSRVRQVAAGFFAHVREPGVSEALVRLLRDNDPMVVLNALSAIAMQGGAAIGSLLRHIEREAEDEFWFHSTVHTLGKLGSEAVGPLLEATSHASAKLRRVACEALGQRAHGCDWKSCLPTTRTIAFGR